MTFHVLASIPPSVELGTTVKTPIQNIVILENYNFKVKLDLFTVCVWQGLLRIWLILDLVVVTNMVRNLLHCCQAILALDHCAPVHQLHLREVFLAPF